MYQLEVGRTPTLRNARFWRQDNVRRCEHGSKGNQEVCQEQESSEMFERHRGSSNTRIFSVLHQVNYCKILRLKF